MAAPKVGVIGLGLLGSALTERLLDAGFSVFVWNRTRSKADRLLEKGAVWSDNPLAASDRVVVSLYTTDVVEEVLKQMDTGLRAGQIVIDTTTGNPQQTADLGARLARRGVHYLEAPVSGSSEQARRGKVLVIAGGEREVYEACRDVFASFAEQSLFAGPWGNGAKMKLVTNLVLGLNRAALGEGIGFARAIGLAAEDALEALIKSVAYSRAMDHKGRKMIHGDFSPQAKLSQHLKDVRLILAEGSRARAKLPLSSLHRQLLEELEAAGFGEEDNSAIMRAFDLEAG